MTDLRILHTSDWHIGQRLHGRSREQEHELYFIYLLDILEEKKIDVLLVSGDIFDVGYPSNSALSHYYSFLTRVVNTSCKKIIITGGNHDYVSTLNAPKYILESLNISVVGGVPEDIADEIIPIYKDGKKQAIICAVPFLRDKEIRKSIVGESYEDKIKAIRDGISAHYFDLEKIVSQENTDKLPVIAMGHLYMAGASTSDSEREIHIGNQANFTYDYFPQQFDYVALGHIHKPQRIAGKDNIRYSGSPIPLSFSERNDNKLMLMLNFSQGKLSVEEINIPAERKLVRIKGNMIKVKEKLSAYKSENNLLDWIELIVEEDFYDPTLMQEFKDIDDTNLDLEIVKMSIVFKDRIDSISELYEEKNSLQDLSEKDVFAKLVDESSFENSEELKNTYNELLEIMNDESLL